jgi:hypothetical protein
MDDRTTRNEKGVVPQSYPYGSITDGDWLCTRCLEPITGCALCAGEAVSVTHISQKNKDGDA